MEREHPAIPLCEPFSGSEVEVDTEIAELVGMIWALGWRTTQSCQDNDGGRVWIAFPSKRHATEFLTVIARRAGYDEDPESLYGRLCGTIEPDDWEDYRDQRAWRYDVWALDVTAPLDDDEEPIEAPFVSFEISIRFPRADREAVEALLREELAGRGVRFDLDALKI